MITYNPNRYVRLNSQLIIRTGIAYETIGDAKTEVTVGWTPFQSNSTKENGLARRLAARRPGQLER